MGTVLVLVIHRGMVMVGLESLQELVWDILRL